MKLNSAQQLIEFGQSVWYDNISRDILFSGEMMRLIKDCGVRGVTSNPTIFDQALKRGKTYDGQINSLRSSSLSVEAVFEELAVQDIAMAADLFYPLYQESGGNDGFVSIEVSPLLASNKEGTVQEAVELFGRLSRPNVMIKVPGTEEGVGALYELLLKGININVTLLFSVENYVNVANTYCEALRARVSKGLPVSSIRSVASFFVSRVDAIVDHELEEIAKQNETVNPGKAEQARRLCGKLGIANSKSAYAEFEKIFLTEQFEDLKQAGAAVQRPLWASTGMKSSKYRDVLYAEELVGPHTVNTMPPMLLDNFIDHGVVAQTVSTWLDHAYKLFDDLQDVGVNVPFLLKYLQEDGVKKFAESFHALNQTLAEKMGR